MGFPASTSMWTGKEAPKRVAAEANKKIVIVLVLLLVLETAAAIEDEDEHDDEGEERKLASIPQACPSARTLESTCCFELFAKRIGFRKGRPKPSN